MTTHGKRHAKQDIMDAAWKLFTEQGYDETTIAQIIELTLTVSLAGGLLGILVDFLGLLRGQIFVLFVQFSSYQMKKGQGKTLAQVYSIRVNFAKRLTYHPRSGPTQRLSFRLAVLATFAHAIYF